MRHNSLLSITLNYCVSLFFLNTAYILIRPPLPFEVLAATSLSIPGYFLKWRRLLLKLFYGTFKTLIYEYFLEKDPADQPAEKG